MKNQNQNGGKKILWESPGFSPLFGLKLDMYHYVLYENSISVTQGIAQKTTQSIPLHWIAAMETQVGILGRIFHCGRLRLITRQYKLPNLEMLVKNPEQVQALIEEAKNQEHKKYLNRQNHRLARQGGDEK